MLWCGRWNTDIRRSELLLPAVLQASGSAPLCKLATMEASLQSKGQYLPLH